MGKQMSKYSHLFDNPLDVSTLPYALTRKYGDIPDLVLARDVFVTDKDGYLTIKNPAPKYRGTAYET